MLLPHLFTLHYYLFTKNVPSGIFQNTPVIKISRPIKSKITPPRMLDFHVSFVPAFLPMARPPRQMPKVTMPMITAERMAEIKGVSTEEMIDIAKKNAERLFGI